MKKNLLILFTFINLYSFSQNYFDKTKEYHYQVTYLIGCDTITNEKMIVKPLGRKWIFQPWSQVAFKYIYFSDSLSFIKYKDNDPEISGINMSYSKVHGKIKLSKKEITGGRDVPHRFFMHPPRSNQYGVLTNAIYPAVSKAALNEDTTMGYGSTFYSNSKDTIDMIYRTYPLNGYIFNGIKIGNCWKIIGESSIKGEVQTSFESYFSLEYGFIQIYYKLEDDVQINFDLIEVKKDIK
jgi:hypothetical protein